MKNIMILVFALMSFLATAQTVTIEKVGNYVRINGIVEGDKYHHIAHLNQNFYNVATGLLTLSSYNNAVLAKKLTLVTIAGATTEAQKLTWLSTNLTLTVSGGGGGGTSDATAANQVIQAVKLDTLLNKTQQQTNSQNTRFDSILINLKSKLDAEIGRFDLNNVKSDTTNARLLLNLVSASNRLDSIIANVKSKGDATIGRIDIGNIKLDTVIANIKLRGDATILRLDSLYKSSARNEIKLDVLAVKADSAKANQILFGSAINLRQDAQSVKLDSIDNAISRSEVKQDLGNAKLDTLKSNIVLYGNATTLRLDTTIANIKLGNNSQNDRLQVLIGKDSTSMSRKDVTIKNIQQTTSTATTVRATTSGTIALDAKFISISNVGTTDGVFNGVALKSYESVTLPYGVGVKYPALTYDATGTEFYIIAIH